MDGFQLLTEIRASERFHPIPVIMMSGIDTRDEIGKCLAIGADSYLIKPLRMQELKLLWQHVHSRQKELVFRDLVLNRVMEAAAAHVVLRRQASFRLNRGNPNSASARAASSFDSFGESVSGSDDQISETIATDANASPAAGAAGSSGETGANGSSGSSASTGAAAAVPPLREENDDREFTDMPAATRAETMMLRALQRAKHRAEVAEAKLEALLVRNEQRSALNAGCASASAGAAMSESSNGVESVR
jgi:CheY-like chemotaxis protein